MGKKKLKNMTEEELYEYNNHSCSVCGKLAKDDSHFYHNKMLCNRHYIQLYRHGKILNDDDFKKKGKRKSKIDSIEKVCYVCGTEREQQFRIWNGEGELKDKCLCTKHYTQMRKHNKITDSSVSAKDKERICEECGSNNDVIYHIESGKMLCRRHYDQIRNYGKILERTIFDKNEYKIMGEITYIYLRDGKQNVVGTVLIDTEDLNNVIKYKWRLGTWGYAETGSTSKNNGTLMQRVILNEYRKDMIPDHINRNKLDNRKCNLRIVNKSENSINVGLRNNNSSGVTGVSYSKSLDSYRAYINYNGKRIELGYRKNIDDAIRLRLNAEIKYYPDYPPQEHLFNKYGIIYKKNK